MARIIVLSSAISFSIAPTCPFCTVMLSLADSPVSFIPAIDSSAISTMLSMRALRIISVLLKVPEACKWKERHRRGYPYPYPNVSSSDYTCCRTEHLFFCDPHLRGCLVEDSGPFWYAWTLACLPSSTNLAPLLEWNYTRFWIYFTFRNELSVAI